MKCWYINLDAADARRRSVEASFGAISPAGWELARFPAVPAAAVDSVPGTITPVEKACFSSHRDLITASAAADEETIMVVEDDMTFASGCFPALDRKLAELEDWDLLFVETLISDLDWVVRLAKARPELVREGSFLLLDLSKVKFAGATSYLVNGRSKRKLADLLARAAPLNLPYDIALRRLVQNGAVTAFALFPFLTSMSTVAEESQVQSQALSASDFILNTLRRLMGLERDMEACRRDAAYIRDKLADEDALLMGTVLAGIMSDAFPTQR